MPKDELDIQGRGLGSESKETRCGLTGTALVSVKTILLSAILAEQFDLHQEIGLVGALAAQGVSLSE
jgi:hypothetical protein